PKNARLVIATSVGSAIGILHRDLPGTYCGIMLDHDLQMQKKTDEDSLLSGTDLVNVLCRNTAHSTAILVHSMNTVRAPAMAARLDRAGYRVTRIPMNFLNENRFKKWTAEAHAIWVNN
ncbi:MAG: cyclic-phosphate processing receiver domain-containing protein, partial [Ktedonobacteraceae bacterium]